MHGVGGKFDTCYFFFKYLLKFLGVLTGKKQSILHNRSHHLIYLSQTWNTLASSFPWNANEIDFSIDTCYFFKLVWDT